MKTRFEYGMSEERKCQGFEGKREKTINAVLKDSLLLVGVVRVLAAGELTLVSDPFAYP